MEINTELLNAASRRVVESYKGKPMPEGDEVLVVFNDCSILYTMEANSHLKIEVNVDKPIIFAENLFEKA